MAFRSLLTLSGSLLVIGSGNVNHISDLSRINVSAATVQYNAAATLTPNATSKLIDGEFVGVAINNPGFKRGDMIAMYLASADFTMTAPLKWTYCEPYLPGYETTGKATAVFQVYNVRAPIMFVLFSGGEKAPVIIVQTPPLTFADYAAPLHPRVLPGGAPGSYAVAWTTSTAATSPALKWGTAAGAYTNTVPATTATLPVSSLCGPPATTSGFMDLGVTATAQLQGLGASHAGQTIHYALVDSSGRSSADFSFVVPPLPGSAPAAYPFYFAAFGDLGRGSFDDGITWSEYGQASRSTVLYLTGDVAGATPPSFVHHFGDISYACGFLQTWDEYLWMVGQFASSVPYLIGVGNHESDYPDSASWQYYGNATDSGGECSKPAATLFPLPAPASASSPWYVFVSGPVTLVVLSTEHDFSTGSAQLAWLKTTLAVVDRKATPFLIISMHRPMYIDSDFGVDVPTGDVNVMNLLQKYVEPITYAAQASVMLYGHNHRLERISAAYQNKTVLASTPQTIDGDLVNVFYKPTAPIHYVAGTAGASFSKNDCSASGLKCPEWSELTAYGHGYLRFTALNDSALVFEYLNTTSGNVIDRVLLVQDLTGW